MNRKPTINANAEVDELEIDVWANVKEGIVDPEPTRGWTLYYDETNNFRKFSIDPTKEEFVNSEDAIYNDFILGGIAVPPGVKLDIDELRTQLGLKKASEMKSRNLFGTDDFLYNMGSKRVQTFLKWMVSNTLMIHYSTTDNLYDAVIEVVDESLMGDRGRAVMIFHREMKDVLYNYIKSDVPGFLKILHRYGYPEMKEEDEREFCKEMALYVEKLNSHADKRDSLFLEMIKQNLMAVSRSDKVEFMNFGVRGEIISSYHNDYWFSVLNTPAAMHVFDHESSVEHDLKDVQLMDKGKPYELIDFRDSKECVYIQISDMFVGILGRTFRWIDNTNGKELLESIDGMSQQQKKSFFLLNELIDMSNAFCPYLIQNMVAESKNRKRFDTLQLISDSIFINK